MVITGHRAAMATLELSAGGNETETDGAESAPLAATSTVGKEQEDEAALMVVWRELAGDAERVSHDKFSNYVMHAFAQRFI